MMNNFIFKKVFSISCKKKFNTRFPPEPNGCLHIGHVKSILINYILSISCNGNFNLRFDDTNPKEESFYFVKLIRNDFYWLNIYSFKLRFTSDYFKFFYSKACFLIKRQAAYVDQLNYEDFLLIKGDVNNLGINSKYRIRSIKENLFLFKRMKDGFIKSSKACLRARIDMHSKSFLLRDPVLYRIFFIYHYRTKKIWCIFPTYDFSHCISDYIENIKFSICTLEFIENKLLFDWLLNNIFNIINVIQIEFAKLEFKNVILSKKKISLLIKNKFFFGWNDFNLFTIQGLRNRGIPSNFIKFFCNIIGVTKKKSMIDLCYFETLLNKFLYKNSIKLMCIINPILLIINNFNNLNFIRCDNNINGILGFRCLYINNKLFINEDDIINIIQKRKYFFKLRFSYFLIINKIIYNINNKIIKIYSFIKNQNVNKVNVLSWVSNYIFAKIIFLNNFSKFYNKDFLDYKYEIKFCFLEYNAFYLLVGQVICLEKIGYFIVKEFTLRYILLISVLLF